MSRLLLDGLSVLGITVAFSSSFGLLGLGLLGLSRAVVLMALRKN